MMTMKDVPEMLILSKDSEAERAKGFYLSMSLEKIANHKSVEMLAATLQAMFDLGYAHGVKTAQVKRN